MQMAENARAELQGLPTMYLLLPVTPEAWLDTHGFPTLIPGQERERLEQTVIIHCGERQARPVEEDSRKEEEARLHTLR